MTHETGTPMTATRALALFQNTSGWLLAAVEQGRTCHCGACFLCAYIFIHDALAQEVLAKGYIAHDAIHEGKTWTGWVHVALSSAILAQVPVLIIKAPPEKA